MATIDQKIGRRVRGYREERGLSLLGAAVGMGIHSEMLRDIERGCVRVTWDIAQILSDFYGKSRAEITQEYAIVYKKGKSPTGELD